MGSTGVFVKELEKALACGEIDIAVHSLKDMPAVQPPGLTVAAVLPAKTRGMRWYQVAVVAASWQTGTE